MSESFDPGESTWCRRRYCSCPLARGLVPTVLYTPLLGQKKPANCFYHTLAEKCCTCQLLIPSCCPHSPHPPSLPVFSLLAFLPLSPCLLPPSACLLPSFFLLLPVLSKTNKKKRTFQLADSGARSFPGTGICSHQPKFAQPSLPRDSEEPLH